MNKYKFRFYSEIPCYIRSYAEDIQILGDEIDSEWDGNIQTINESDIILPKQYWREGMYLFSHLKNPAKEISRKRMFGYSEYKALFFYKETWYSCTELENEIDRLGLSQPSQKEWEVILSIPEKYLNDYYKSYRSYWWWFYETNRMKYDTKLASYKYFKEYN